LKENKKPINLGAHPNNEAFKKWLKKYLKANVDPKRLKWTTIFKWIFWTFLMFWMLGIIPLMIAIVGKSQTDIQLKNMLPLWITLEVLFFIGTIAFGIVWWNSSKKSCAAIKEALPEDIYSRYYHLAFPKCPLKFKGLQPSVVYPGHDSFVFEINGEQIIWDIEEHQETRTEFTKVGTKSYQVYVMRYFLTLHTKQLDHINGITMSRRLTKKTTHYSRDEFLSSSANFNKRFKVTTKSTDLNNVTRLFTPEVISRFDDMPRALKKVDAINFEPGVATLGWKSPDAYSPWKVNLNHLKDLKLNDQDYLLQITKTLEHDFDRFFKNLALFAPFDFYHLNKLKKI